MTQRKPDRRVAAKSAARAAAKAVAKVAERAKRTKGSDEVPKKAQREKAAKPRRSKASGGHGGIDPVHVADQALATIVGLAAHEVPGVVGMAPASLSEGLRRILGLAQVDEGVEVERDADGTTTRLALHVVVAYGVNIPAVADSVVERVRYAARAYAGVNVAEVKVHVAGVSRA
jgi:uncharacterized alkaline shock family protein YloU